MSHPQTRIAPGTLSGQQANQAIRAGICPAEEKEIMDSSKLKFCGIALVHRSSGDYNRYTGFNVNPAIILRQVTRRFLLTPGPVNFPLRSAFPLSYDGLPCTTRSYCTSGNWYNRCFCASSPTLSMHDFSRSAYTRLPCLYKSPISRASLSPFARLAPRCCRV